MHLTPFSLGLCACTTVQLMAAEPHVWVVTETRHVLRSELPGQTRQASLSSARNEWVGFQVLVRADEPLQGLTLKAGEWRGPDGQRSGALQVHLYRQHQLILDAGTYRNADFAPDGYPDPLIPFEHPLAGMRLKGGRLTAMPFDLPAHETHGYWVDLYVPATAEAGQHRGNIRIGLGLNPPLEVPILLNVWDFALPPVPALKTEFGSPAARLRSYYRRRASGGEEAEPQDWAAVEAQCSQLLADHRLNAVPPATSIRPGAQPDGSFLIPDHQLESLRAFVERYHVNAVRIPHPSSVVKDPDAEGDRLRRWLQAFDAAAEKLGSECPVFYTYLKDEPNTLEDYRYVQRWGRAIRAARSVVQVLVVEQTWTASGQGGADSAWGDLYGAVDIWCPLFSLHRQETAVARQALGETIWTYTALCQGKPTPWWHIDYPLLNYRVPAWMAWHDRIRGLLYWGGLSYWGPVNDPWVEAPYYAAGGARQREGRRIRYYGEGSLVYPARAVGYDGVVPTIRLKALRDAIEDYDYLALLERLGKAEEAEAIVEPLTASFFSWNRKPVAYEEARARLANLILASVRNRRVAVEPQ